MRKSARELLSHLVTLSLALLSASSLVAQSSSVELIGTVTANQVSQGLGFNLDANQDWEWAAAAAAGATHARIQCSWSLVEQQTAPPRNAAAGTQYVQDPACAAGFVSAAKYGIHPTVVAAYGPPYHQILTVTLPGGAASGATSLNVEFQAGVGGDTLENIAFPNDYICPVNATTLAQEGAGTACSGQITGRNSYEGTLITGVKLVDSTHATLTLASAVTTALPAGSAPYIVNEILYPSAATASPTDRSVEAYSNYVNFLAEDMAARGLTGDIELWNEPPWVADPWDFRAELYDANTYPGAPGFGADFGFAANLMKRSLPAGITATWNGTSGSASGSLLSSNMKQFSGEALVEPSTTVTAESFHPYSGHYANPEDSLWISSCLQAEASAGKGGNCALPGQAGTSNLWEERLWNYQQKDIHPSYGLGGEVTETNELPPAAGMQVQQARAILRQYIGFEADGVTPIEFFKLYFAGMSDPTFGFVQEVDGSGIYTPTPSYTAISGFMSDIAPISKAPVTESSASDLPSVASYSGEYALGSAHLVGSREGATANSDAFIVWQLTACTTTATCWYNLPSPAAGPIKVNIPLGLSVTSVTNLTTRTAVTYQKSGQQISFSVADDPIEIIVDPNALDIAATTVGARPTLILSATPSTTSYGTQVVLTATLSPYLPAKSTNNEPITFALGTTVLGKSQLSSGVATFNVTSLSVGTNVLQATYAGDKNFAATEAVAVVPVAQASPNVTFAGIPSQVLNTSKLTITTTSLAPANMTPSYSVVSGPARIVSGSGQSIVVGFTGTGTVVLQAKQIASTNYAAQTVQTSFNVQAVPTLALPTIATQTYGTTPFSIAAHSSSPVAIAYSVVSGPAVVSGSTLTLTGLGTVVLQASQAENATYIAATTQTSFTVLGKSPNLTLASIASQPYSPSPIPLSATSLSPEPITYSVVSGPAVVSGSKVTLTGLGNVVLRASQIAVSTFTAGTAQLSFTVTGASPNLALPSIPNQTYGISPIQLNPSTLSPGPITYVVSGPATVSRGALNVTGIGAVTVKANQAASGNFAAAATQTSFSVAQESPKLSFSSLPGRLPYTTPIALQTTSLTTLVPRITVLSGPARIKSGTGQSFVVGFFGPGTVVLQASLGAYGNFTAQTIQITFTVTNPSAAALSFAPLGTQTYGEAPFNVLASSGTPGAITYSTVSGPASLAGSTVTLTGVGTVVLQASQSVTGSNTVQSATTSFSVLGASPNLAVASIPNQANGAAAFPVSATSSSSGAITYSVASGPASIAGNLVSVNGAGTVVIQASQVAAGNYAAATAQANFSVRSAHNSLALSGIGNQTYGASPFAITATSNSTALITYSVISGPASLSGNTVALTGVGNVVLQASQAASSSYPAATAQTAFTVLAEPATLNFTTVANTTYGSGPVLVSATSNSPGIITYAVVSGPGTLSGNTMVPTGAGSIVVQASVPATGNYGAATAQTSFMILPESPGLSFVKIPSQSVLTKTVTPSAKSLNPTTPTYKVVSGPAEITSSTNNSVTLTLLGEGAVRVRATQAASGGFTSDSCHTTFDVK